MNVRIESMSHGDGKIYLQMVLDRLNPNAKVLLDARLKNGKKIPAHLLPFTPLDPSSAANYVVVLPRFEVREVDLSFVEYSGEGSPLSQSRLTVEMNMIRWRTRFNTLIHNELNDQMFEVEREHYANRINSFFARAIDDGDEVVVKMVVDMPQTEGAEVMVDFTDQWGNELDLPVYPLEDEVISPEQFGDLPRLRIGFSVRVRKENKEFCATVYDSNDLVAGGFAYFCDETYAPLHELFFETMADASQDDGYEQWYRHHSETLAGLALQAKQTFSYEPVISLIVPLYEEDLCYLPAFLVALSQQSYEHYELVVVDCGLDDALFERYFREWLDDERMLHIACDATLDEASARANGLLQSSGQVCAIVGPQVIMAPEALFEYVRHVNAVMAEEKQDAKNPVSEDGKADKQERQRSRPGTCEVVYANHDYFDRGIGFHDPQIKPSFSPDLLYSQFYTGPVVFVERSIIDAICQNEGFSTDAFEYDLMLKASVRANRIDRIDKVLYHVQDAACISEQVEKVASRREEEAFRLGRKALALHLRRQRIDAVVLSEISQRIYQVKYRLPDPRPSLSIIIPIKDEAELLDICLSSLVEHDTLDRCEIVIVDNNSIQKTTREYLDSLDCKLPHVRVMSFDSDYNPSAIANAAAATCSSDYLLFLDNDTEVISENAISAMLASCMRKDVGVVGAKMLYPDDTIQHAGILVGAYGSAGSIGVDLPRNDQGYMKRLKCSSNVSAVSGSAMMVRKSIFDSVGGFDERFKVSCYDVDFCLRVNKAGYRVVFNGSVELYHQENATSGHSLSKDECLRAERERALFRYRWAEYFIEGDPFYSTCLDGEFPYFRLK